MSRPNSFRRHLAVWALIYGLWALLVLAFAGQLVFTAGLGWVEALRLALRDWFGWALLAPVVAWLAFRFPLDRQELALSIPLHLAGCILAVVAAEFLVRPFSTPQPLPPGPPGAPFRLRGAPLPEGPVPRPMPDRPGPREPGFDPRPLPLPEPRRGLLVDSLLMRARFNVPVYWIIVSIVHAFTYYRRSEERERQAAELEARLAQARLDALRMQLHPHFLFNTLNAIATLVHKDANAADEMINNLSELLRTTLEDSEPVIPLRRELEFLDRYLDIQQVRFGDRLKIEREIDPQALAGRVPALILQPLVENAIRHGIEPATGTGIVRIQAQRVGETLQLLIRNNGGEWEGRSANREGIGLANTKARLEALYGSKATLTLSRPAEGGCTVALTLPFQPEAAAPAPAPDQA